MGREETLPFSTTLVSLGFAKFHNLRRSRPAGTGPRDTLSWVARPSINPLCPPNSMPIQTSMAHPTARLGGPFGFLAFAIPRLPEPQSIPNRRYPPETVPSPRVQAPFPGIDEVLLSVDSGRAESRSHRRSIAGVIKTLYRLIGQWMLTGRIGRVVIRSETFSFGCSSGPWRISSPLGGSFNGGNRYGLMYCVMVG